MKCKVWELNQPRGWSRQAAKETGMTAFKLAVARTSACISTNAQSPFLPPEYSAVVKQPAEASWAWC